MIEIIGLIIIASFASVAVEFYQTATLNIKRMVTTAIILTALIVFTYLVLDLVYIRPLTKERNRIGTECCLNMNGEINKNICKYEGMYMTQETDLQTLGNHGTMEHQIYCAKNEKLINKLKGREE